jgi:6-phosphogluconolactonase (cycloisomerase 2 family)
MYRNISALSLALATTFASTVLASAQVTSSPTDANSVQTGSSPVAYVYVSNNPGSNNQINAYAAASNGTLSGVKGSPFPTTVSYMAANEKYLFGTDGSDIDSFAIASDGALQQVDSYLAEPDGGLSSIYLDRSGKTLHADYYTINNDYLSYSIDNTTGELTFVNDLPGGPPNNSPVSFIGDDAFAYSSSCYHFGPEIVGVQRASDGALSYLSGTPPFPTTPTGDFYCPWLAAADPTNHIAIAMQPLNGNWTTMGPYQLASYTVDGSGNLATSSTYLNMPQTLVGTVNDYKISPSGKLLAIGGSSGLQVFHFNGANPITKYTKLLTTEPVTQMFWDNANHLYAISQEAGKLYVYTVTSTSVTAAPGSPYTIPGIEELIVLPKS